MDSLDGNYRPDLKGLRLSWAIASAITLTSDGNYRPDLKGLRHFRRGFLRRGFLRMEITDLI